MKTKTLSNLPTQSLSYYSIAIGLLGIMLILPAVGLVLLEFYLAGVGVLAMAIFVSHVADLFRNEARFQRGIT